jgi:hypothetical protein
MDKIKLLTIKISEKDLKELFKRNPELKTEKGVLYFKKVKK